MTLRKIILSTLCFSVLFLSACNNTEPGTKVAVINFATLYQQSELSKEMTSYLEKLNVQLEAELIAEQQKAQESGESDQFAQLQAKIMMAQQQLTQENDRLSALFMQTIQTVTDTYRVQNKIDIVISSEVALSVDTKLDITDAIIGALNATKVNIAPEQPAASASPAPTATPEETVAPTTEENVAAPAEQPATPAVEETVAPATEAPATAN